MSNASTEPADGHAPLVKVSGQPLQAAWLASLASLRVDRGLGLVGRATLRFVDRGFALSTSNALPLGAEVVISTYRSSLPLLTGTVTAVQLEASGVDSELVVTVDDAAGKLRRPVVPTSDLNATTARIVKDLGTVCGVGVDVNDSALGTETHDYLMRTGSALAYLEAAVSQAGAVWWTDGATIRIEKATTTVGSASLELGKALTTFSVRASAAPMTRVEVRGWDVKQKKAVTAEASTAVARESTFTARASGRSGTSSPVATVRAGAPASAAEAKLLAEAMVAEARAGSVVARGTCLGTGGLAPAVALAVTHAGPASGTYRVSRVEHVYNRDGFRTHFTAGPLRPSGLVDTLGPRAADPGMHIEGVVVGVVTNNDDPQGLSRVKVTFPDLSEQVESAWARVATVGGGSSRGIFFLPEVNDEVLVAFELGDTRRPLVLGGLYGGKDASPLTAKAALDNSKVAKRQIKSRAGHVIELSDNDAAAEKHLLLENADGAKVRIGADKTTIDSGGKPIEILGAQGAAIKISDSGAVTIEGASITVKGSTGAVKIEGVGVEAKSSTTAKVEAQVQAVLKGAMTTVESSGVTAVKGSMVQIN